MSKWLPQKQVTGNTTNAQKETTMESRLSIKIKNQIILSNDDYRILQRLLLESLITTMMAREKADVAKQAYYIAAEYQRNSFIEFSRDEMPVSIRVGDYDQLDLLFAMIVERFPQLHVQTWSDSTFTNVRDVRAGSLTHIREHMPAGL